MVEVLKNNEQKVGYKKENRKKDLANLYTE